jgi:hypothetical protein
VLVVDTRKFPKGTFVQDSKAMTHFAPYSETLQEMCEPKVIDLFSHNGEYLSQGCLDVSGQCSQTSMQQLVDAGLFTLCPQLSMPKLWDQLVLPVFGIRMQILRAPEESEKKDVRLAITVAEACFGSRWAIPLAAMLLLLQPRKPSDKTILDGFRSMFSGELIMTIWDKH